MIVILTRDEFLFQGVAHVLKNEDIIRIEKILDMAKYAADPASKVIIDVYHNNVIDDDAVSVIQTLNVHSVIVLAPFHISKLKCRPAIFFVNRRMPLVKWVSLLTAPRMAYSKPKMGFSLNQFKIVSHFLKEKDNDDIACALNISEETLRSQKFNIMLKLKLRRMRDIVTLPISPYF